MANQNGHRSVLRTFLPLAALWLAACAVPDSSEGPAVPVVPIPDQPLLAGPATDIKAMIVIEAVRQGTVPPALALAVAKVGSNIAGVALGASGAVGTMQIPPRLADEFDMDADDLRSAEPNIRASIACLAELHARYAGDWRLALSHYRGGPLQETNGGFTPHQFTRRYVRDVLRWWRLYRNDPLIGAWLRKTQGLPRFSAAGDMRGPAVVAASAAPTRAYGSGRWHAVTGGRRFR